MDPRNFTNKIKQLKIQGAHAIAVASLDYIKKYSHSLVKHPKKQYLSRLQSALSKISLSRPTEPFTFNLLKIIKIWLVKNHRLNKLTLDQKLNDLISKQLRQIELNRYKIAQGGLKLIKDEPNIFTHCHSSEVENLFKLAKEQHKKFHVYHTETRPLYQGRITARHLIKLKIPVTMVTDSAAGFLISKSSGKAVMMDLAFLGADALLPDGSVINKIGSYNIGLSCYHEKTPLYIVSSLLKFDSSGSIPIEIRPSKEIWPNKPTKLEIINFSFDKIPSRFIKGIICEFGVIKPSQIKKFIIKYYPEIL